VKVPQTREETMPLIAITREMGSLGIEVAEQVGAARACADAHRADFDRGE